MYLRLGQIDIYFSLIHVIDNYFNNFTLEVEIGTLHLLVAEI